MSAQPSRLPFLALCCLTLLAAGSATAQEPAKDPANNPVTCKGPFKALLETSHAKKRGVTLFLNGETVSGTVAACNADGSIELTGSQIYSRIVVIAERINAAAM